MSPYFESLCHPQSSRSPSQRCEKAEKADSLRTGGGETAGVCPLPKVTERLCIRVLIGIGLCLALTAFVLAPVPANAQGNPVLPASALGQVTLYRLEVSLLVFYGCLLLITPALIGLLHGRLPTEISTRGAKFAEEADQSAELTKAAVKQLERTTGDLSEDLASAQIEINRLGELLSRDKTQLKVDSKP